MADNTHIEWTDATWNPVTGCSVVSPGCANCYAMKLAGTRLKHHPSRVGLTRDSKAGPVWTGEVRFNSDWLDQPILWTKPRMIFVAAHGDLFAEGVPDEWIDKVFAVMALAPQHVFQVLTKRPERMRDYLTANTGSFDVGHACGRIATRIEAIREEDGDRCLVGPVAHLRPGERWWPLPNVWLGVSVEDQRRADERIPILLDTPAAIRWISAEPLLGPIDLTKVNVSTSRAARGFPYLDALRGSFYGEEAIRMGIAAQGTFRGPLALDWVVAGGESGRDARPMHPDWARSLRNQCAAAGVPFLFKQWGEWASNAYRMSTGEMVFRQFSTFQQWVNKASTWVAGGICLDAAGNHLRNGGDFARARDEGRFPVTVMHRVGKKAAGRTLDGRTWDQFPEPGK